MTNAVNNDIKKPFKTLRQVIEIYIYVLEEPSIHTNDWKISCSVGTKISLLINKALICQSVKKITIDIKYCFFTKNLSVTIIAK